MRAPRAVGSIRRLSMLAFYRIARRSEANGNPTNHHENAKVRPSTALKVSFAEKHETDEEAEFLTADERG
jgi:hypothetical protein